MKLCDAPVPTDYSAPKWAKSGKVHDWKNYISNPLRDIWSSFSEVQRAVMAQNAQDIADQEEWD